MAIKPTDLPVISKEDQAEIKRLEKNIDKAIKARWEGGPIKLPGHLFGKRKMYRDELKKIYITAGWTVIDRHDDKNSVVLTPMGHHRERCRRILDEDIQGCKD
jgi:hypothetical protein